MAINTSNAGIMKPVAKNIGILWYAPAGTDVSVITDATTTLPVAFKDAGAITTDGLTKTENTEEGEIFKDWNGLSIDSEEATSAPSVTFALLEILSDNAMKLVYADAAITATAGNITKIVGTDNPSNKVFVIDTLLKGRRMRLILTNASFNGRGDLVYATDALASQEVTYTLLADEDGVSQIALYEAV